jgi:hypothetical protein
MMASVFWDHKGVDRIHGTRDHNNVRDLLWNAEYASEVDPKQTAQDAH